MDRKLIIGICIGAVIITGSVGFSVYSRHSKSLNSSTTVSANTEQQSSNKYVIDSTSPKALENQSNQANPNNPVNQKGLVSNNNINGSSDYKTISDTNLPNINDTNFSKDSSTTSKSTSVTFSESNKTAFSKLYPGKAEPLVSDSSQNNILVLANQRTLTLANNYMSVINNFLKTNNAVVAKEELSKLDSQYSDIVSTLNVLGSSFNNSNYSSSCSGIVDNIEAVKEVAHSIYDKYNGNKDSINSAYANLGNLIYVIQSNFTSISQNINYNALQEWTQSNGQ